MAERRYWLETLGCPKNQVDSDKLAGRLAADGYRPAQDPAQADLVVVNTCAFIEPARQESVDTVLDLAAARRPGARLVVTGCMAERYGDELAAAIPEADLVAGFGRSLVPPVPVRLGPSRRRGPAGTGPAAGGVTDFDLLELPRPATGAPWAYVKVAEGCDRRCGFCAIPSFRGRQRSRPLDAVLAEVEALAAAGTKEIVLVAQDLASFGRDRSGATPRGARPAGSAAPIVDLTASVAAMVERVRLLYLYPTGLTEALIEGIVATGVPYFDLSLQHVSRPLLARMRRWGDGGRFLDRIAAIRALDPAATFRSSFILGYPGETETDHDRLLDFLDAAQLDWAGFFLFSPEDGTHATTLDGQVPAALARQRLAECAELQDRITAQRRDRLVGAHRRVLVDRPGHGRTIHEAPEIDGLVRLPQDLVPGTLCDMVITECLGVDLVAEPLGDRAPVPAAVGAGAAPHETLAASGTR